MACQESDDIYLNESMSVSSTGLNVQCTLQIDTQITMCMATHNVAIVS